MSKKITMKIENHSRIKMNDWMDRTKEDLRK